MVLESLAACSVADFDSVDSTHVSPDQGPSSRTWGALDNDPYGGSDPVDSDALPVLVGTEQQGSTPEHLGECVADRIRRQLTVNGPLLPRELHHFVIP